MKKLLIAILLFAGTFSFANAQTKQKKDTKKATTSAAVTTKTKTAPTAKVEKTTSTKHMKANGTPDKRYKENKASSTAAGPLKKDGTPDKRYKANKK